MNKGIELLKLSRVLRCNMQKHLRNAQILKDDMFDTVALLDAAIVNEDDGNKLQELNRIMERMKKARYEIDRAINNIGVCNDWHVVDLAEMERNED